MPYFSFSLSDSFNINHLQKLNLNLNQLRPNLTYFSKNTLLWKILNNKMKSLGAKALTIEKKWTFLAVKF